MATTTRQGSKTITMASEPDEPSKSWSRNAGGLTTVDFAFKWIGRRKGRMRPMKPRKQREWRSRRPTRSFK